jgi:hypothetical protein
MAESIRVWLKKVFSLTLMLNSMITLTSIATMLYGFYHSWPYWKPYSPYLISGNVFLLVGAAGLINIFPSASIGRKLHTGRFLFHHYVYGAVVMATSAFCVVAFTSVSLVSLFLIGTPNVAINAGRLFVLMGFIMFLDDLPDVSKRVESTLNKIKSGFCRIRMGIHILQLSMGLVTLYVFLAVAASSIAHSSLTISNSIIMGTFLVTSITSFAFVARKEWLKITPPCPNQSSH